MMITDFTFVFWIRQVNRFIEHTTIQNLINNNMRFPYRYVKIKFVQLNAILQNMLTTTIDSPQHKRMLRTRDNWEDDSSLSTFYGIYKAYENFAKLKRVKQIHLELMKCASILNEVYELQILISIFTSLLFIITLLYNLCVVLMTSDYYNWIMQFYMHFSWIFYHCIKIFAITNMCQRTITEICRFMYQLIENRLTFTVCRFYDLDHTFIYSAIGSIMTYLFIFLQVGDKPNVFFNNTIYNSTSIM
uniref:Gustatory receptor n=1 Tax=Vespula pensylvanica TaxID=30213 RepID=A0A834PA17_VESPE|nr:hypothetical protein H0235_002541 [Vespula pensylvanica]